VKSKRIAIPYIIWMIIFTVVPLAMVAYYAVTNKQGELSFEPMMKILIYKDAFIRSLIIAFISTAICLIIAYPLAYIMSRCRANARRTMVMLIMLPMWMNFLLRIYSWMMLLQDGGIISNIISFFGIKATLLGNSGAVVLGMVYNFLPFMVLPLYTVMLKIDNSIIEAANDLGANTLRTFSKVIIPLSVPGIISGITMVFVPAASTFLVSTYLGGPNDMLIGDIIQKEFPISRNVGSAMSLVLMVIMLIFIGVMNKFGDEEAIF